MPPSPSSRWPGCWPKPYIVPIPGSRNTDRVADNIAAAQVKLTAEDLAAIAEIDPDGGQGGRLD
ncbi:aldo/keto reductase [Actinomadura napierensis]|uniref:NADP-dependent oxidoreductase domain-containing protein n=1 Tax=Actinomadura napierensis TaxID=267854 RepID=A0ABN2YEJ4_9ACTN